MPISCFADDTKALPLYLLTADAWPNFCDRQTAVSRAWLKANGFQAKPKQWCLVPDAAGHIAFACVGIATPVELYALSDLALSLPEGAYRIANREQFDRHDLYLLTLGFGLGAYQYARYKAPNRASAQLVLDAGLNGMQLQHELEASYWARDLINTPAEDLMPEHLALEAEQLAQRFNGHCQQIIGEDLLTHNYPMIHAVGRASSHAPRLLDLHFGAEHLPKVTLVGKGVCFDSGGLDIKPSSGMLTMKKDMGGAAHVLALAQWVLQERLPIRLRVLIPTVENAIGGNAFHPGDVLNTRAGLTVEIGNTDAEGRLILADALTEAVSEQPELLIDFATLTGAARIAVGTDIAAYFSNDEALASELQWIADHHQDPSWRLPLFAPYTKLFHSTIADLNNATSSPYAGAITAALFLQAFVPDDICWAHFDIMAFNVSASSGKPVGGEAMGLRAAFHLLAQRFG